MPKVSLILAVRNGMPYLPEAIKSLLAQTFSDFELILIDDASTDGSLDYLQSLSDPRIRLQRNQRQKGLAASLNIGLDLAQGEYIARMDADDISLPRRLERQVAYLQTHPELSICGSWARTFGEGKEQLWRYPEQDAQIKAEMIFASVLVHSSVMMRASHVKEHIVRYDESQPAAQDYALWAELQDRVKFANLPQVLLRYRLHPQQMGGRKGGLQQQVADRVREEQLARFGFSVSEEDRTLHHRVARWDFANGLEALPAIEGWLLRLFEANMSSAFLDSDALGRTLERRWWAACRAQSRQGLQAWTMYKDSKIAAFGRRSALDRGLFAAKSLASSLGLRR